MASSGTRLWPPASTLASSPCSASSGSTSSTDRGRVVLEAAAFFTPAPPRCSSRIRDGGRCCSWTRTPKRLQRVLDRVREARRGDDHPALADAPEVDVRVGEDRVDVVDLEVRHDGRRRHQVVHERRREELTVVPVRRVLEQHRADRLRDAAADLALDDRRVDRQPAVLDDHVAVDADEAGLDVDLDLGARGCHRTSRSGRRRTSWVTTRSVSAPSGSRAGSSATMRASSRERQLDRRAIPCTLITPSLISRSAALASSRSAARERTLLAQLARRVQHHAVRHRRRPAAAGADERERRHVGVAEHDLDVLEPDAELVDRDLRQRRLVALAVGLLAGDDARRCRRPPARRGLTSLPMIVAPMSSCPGAFGPGAASRYDAMPMPRYRPSRRASAWRCRKPAQSTMRAASLDLLLGGDGEERLTGEHRERRFVPLRRSCGGARRADRGRAPGR